MNESKQETEVPSEETSGREVGESYIPCSKLASTSFRFQTKLAPKVISSEKLRIDLETDFIRPGKSGKPRNFF